MGMGIHHSDQAMGTLGGTLIAFIGMVDGSDIIKTGILGHVWARWSVLACRKDCIGFFRRIVKSSEASPLFSPPSFLPQD